MKYIVIIFTTVCILFSCQSAKESPPLVFHFEQTNRFVDVMDYLEAKDPSGFTKAELSHEVIYQNFEINKTDVVLNQKIDALLNLSDYDDLSKITSSHVNDTSYTGRDAYRMSFLYLPKTRIDMTAGMAETWATFWENNHDADISKILSKIREEQEIITKRAFSTSARLLPKDITRRVSTDVIFKFDGNRGSYTTDSQIFMEMLGFATDDFSIDRFTNKLTHELHHIYYGNWFSDQLPSEKKSDKQEALFKYMEPLILEGIAQQLDHHDKSDAAKSLYYNPQIIEQLYDSLTASIRKIANSNDPLTTFEEEQDKIWNSRKYYLNKYRPDGYDQSLFPDAPTIVYYLGYHLYNSIHQEGGQERLDFVIENFDQLLSEYNKIYTTDLLIPKIPDDIVQLWKDTFEYRASSRIDRDDH